MSDAFPRPWPHHGSRHEPSLLLFRPRWDMLENPRTGERLERLVLETPDWVNVVARATDGRFVMVRQYRFGVGAVTLELPGGMIDRGKAPRAAAERELREETGFHATAWTALGHVEPNPAIHDNRCYQFLAEGCALTAVQDLDPGEDIQVVLQTEDELRAGIERGEIAHTLVLSALARVIDLRGVIARPRG
ncbi:MAG: NUDIX hydrolase [Planctomycetota bacterium]